jgi:dTDP-4-dehydrorhamnose reductase
MANKTVIIGAHGQLGRDLCPRLPGEVVPLARAQADLMQPESLRAVLTAEKPSLVVNCAAYNFVDKAETEPEAAFAVNAWGVRALAEVCRDLDCALLHFSTDYVFGLGPGRDHPWIEDDAPGPVSVYGLSKLAGEYLVRSICPRHFVARTCGLYGVWGSGGKGGNFVETMLRVGGQGKPLRVVGDQRCTPSYTVDVATAAAELVQTEKYGLYHLTNNGCCSWYEFASTIFQEAGLTVQLTPIASAEYGAKAHRPTYSVLDGTRAVSVGIPPLRRWQDALSAYLAERTTKR